MLNYVYKSKYNVNPFRTLIQRKRIHEKSHIIHIEGYIRDLPFMAFDSR